MANTKPNKVLNLNIRDRQGPIMQNEEVFAVTSVNAKGPFDILPEHENFISIIKDRVIVHKKRDDRQEIKIGTGILKVNANKVDVFLGMHSKSKS